MVIERKKNYVEAKFYDIKASKCCKVCTRYNSLPHFYELEATF